MVDVTLPSIVQPIQWSWGRPITPVSLIGATLLLFAILASINWSAVLTKTERKCEAIPGAFRSGFNSGFQIWRCHCGTPFIDFAESCDSMYVPAL